MALDDENCASISLKEILGSTGKGIVENGSYYRIPTAGEIKNICRAQAKSSSH